MKNLLKKVLIILSILLLCGCSSSKIIKKQVVVEGNIFLGSSDFKVSMGLVFRPSWVTVADNTKYNKDLASFCCLASTDVYFRQKDLEKNIQNRVLIEGQDTEYNNKSFLESFGYKDVEFIDISKNDDFFGDTNDTNVFLIGHQEMDKYENFVVVLRGTYSPNEWLSDFDLGNDELVYQTINGPHLEWQHKYIYKGIDVTSTRVKKYVDDYIKEHSNEKKIKTILLTGHSRGGCIANIIGSSYEDEGVRSYTYTFSALPMVEEQYEGDYKTIFNIIDENDLYYNIFPYKNDKLTLFGKSIISTIKGNEKLSKQMQDLINKVNVEYFSSEDYEKYKNLFANYFNDRKNLYDIITLTKKFDNVNDAVAKRNEIMELISNKKQLDCEKYCSVGEIKRGKEAKFEFDIVYSKGAILVCFSKFLAFGETQYNNLINVFKEDEDVCEMSKVLFKNIKKIKAGHLIVNDYVIANEE